MQIAMHYSWLLQNEMFVVCFHEIEIKVDIQLSDTCNLSHNLECGGVGLRDGSAVKNK